MADLFKKAYEFKDVDNAVNLGIYPYFHALESKQDIVVKMEGKRRVMIGSNNYLGLTGDKRVIDATVKAVKIYGTGVSGSRFLNGTLTLHLELEKELAEFMEKEAALTFPSGFQSTLAIISAIAGRDDIIFSDRENHACIYDGIRLSFASSVRYNHNDMKHLEQLLQEADSKAGKLIVTDGIFSMSGDIAKLPEIVALAEKYGARVMVDDAHSFGVLGAKGRGTAEYFGLHQEVDMIMSTFSKSLASIGGFMVGKKEVVNYIKHKSRPFIFSAALTPASTASALAALRILKKEPQRPKALLDIAAYARKKMIEKKLPLANDTITPIIPIYTYTMMRTFVIAKLLYKHGVYVNPVIPPAAPEGQCLIRTSYTATHTKPLIDEAVNIIDEVLKKVPMDEKALMSMLHEFQ
ncbi:MAG: aminotransferase class I/II-fold pyridoxal phosphate-dependent enzyme [Firmicutes bacterium]|nr:aminotransferase class I/II-fold pyridoxal phosphate-dependent enzyme [Bacillota bacterium]